MSSRKFQEILPCGGKLTVTEDIWSIEYYFPGPDRRHNGKFFRIPSNELSSHIDALIANFEEYELLKRKFGDIGEIKKDGLMGMTLRVGGHWRGVCLESYQLCIGSVERLEEVVSGYRYAIEKAPKIQAMLRVI